MAAKVSGLTEVKSSGAGRLTRADLVVLGGLLVVAVCAAVFVLRAPSMVGHAEDDGVYLTTSKALAEGKGYRHLQLPGEPLQSKYPILYPLVLSIIWRLFPSFPENVPVILILNIVLWAAGSWIAYRLMRRLWELPWWLPGAGILLTFVNPSMLGTGATLGITRSAMAEPLYLLLSTAALATAAFAPSTPPAGRGKFRGYLCAASSGLLAAGAFLARSIGVTVIAAVAVDFLLRRRAKLAAVFAVAPLLTVLAWRAWCAYAQGINAQNPAASVLSYDLDYTYWVPRSFAELLWVAYHNTAATPMALLMLLIPLPTSEVAHILHARSGTALLLYLGVVVMSALILVGAVSVWRRTRAAIHLYLLFYLALILAWPFHPWRFLLPVLPFLISLLLAGVYVSGVFLVGSILHSCGRAAEEERSGDLRAGLSGRWNPHRPGAGSAAGLVALVVIALAYLSVRPPIAVQGGWQRMEQALRNRDALVELLRTHTPEDAVICSPQPGYLHLRTGRHFVPFLPRRDQIRHSYPKDRTFSSCGYVLTKGQSAADLEQMESHSLDYLRITGARYIVPMPERTTYYGALFAEVRRKRPWHFRLIHEVGPFSVYLVVPPSR